MENLKTCVVCKVEKDTTYEYRRSKYRADGFQDYCIDCNIDRHDECFGHNKQYPIISPKLQTIREVINLKRKARVAKHLEEQLAKEAKHLEEPLAKEAKHLERQKQINDVIALFKSGNTCKQIGSKLGFSKQKANVILREAGVKRIEGGSGLRAIITQQKFEAKKDIKSFNKRGMDYKSYQAVPQKIRVAYLQQKRDAGYRGIKWEFNLASWLKVWVDSGHLAERGKGSGKFVMSRPNDQGQYSPSTVKIITHNENSLECRNHADYAYARGTKRSWATSKYIGVSWRTADNAWFVCLRFNNKLYYLGQYKNEIDAAVAYNRQAIVLFGKDAKLNRVA